jgi:type 1 fimbria pilin
MRLRRAGDGKLTPVRRSPLVIALTLVLALGASACGSESNEGGPEQDAGGTIVPETGEDVGAGSGNLSVALRELEGSQLSGNATITAAEGTRVRVSIQLEGGGGRSAYPAHIHAGSCDSLGDVEHELENVEDGTSETLLDGLDIDDLQDGDFSIDVHEDGGADAIACGQIGSAG